MWLDVVFFCCLFCFRYFPFVCLFTLCLCCLWRFITLTVCDTPNLFCVWMLLIAFLTLCVFWGYCLWFRIAGFGVGTRREVTACCLGLWCRFGVFAYAWLGGCCCFLVSFDFGFALSWVGVSFGIACCCFVWILICFRFG